MTFRRKGRFSREEKALKRILRSMGEKNPGMEDFNRISDISMVLAGNYGNLFEILSSVDRLLGILEEKGYPYCSSGWEQSSPAGEKRFSFYLGEDYFKDLVSKMVKARREGGDFFLENEVLKDLRGDDREEHTGKMLIGRVVEAKSDVSYDLYANIVPFGGKG